MTETVKVFDWLNKLEYNMDRPTLHDLLLNTSFCDSELVILKTWIPFITEISILVKGEDKVLNYGVSVTVNGESYLFEDGIFAILLADKLKMLLEKDLDGKKLDVVR